VGFIEDDHFDDEQCLALLRRAQFGRIALTLRAVPIVFPVRYAVSGEALLFSLSVDQLADALDKTVATLQADGFEEDSGKRWTVLAAGPVRRIRGFDDLGPEAVLLSFAPEAVSGERGGLFRLEPAILSGRWIEGL
jgi:uncharacterized protein